MTTTLYFSWRDVPKAKWRWASFSPAEIACRGDGSIKINEQALDCLQALRDHIGKPHEGDGQGTGRQSPGK